jgi:hypothetical protein
VDYKKAFDSVPHPWLLRVLELFKIDPKVIQLHISCMISWRRTLHVRTESSSYKTDELPIQRRIFQGDSLSPLWFCLALNPLIRMLRTSGYGYIVKRRPNVSIFHQFYMDDLKLYARSPDQLQRIFALVKSFSDSVCMKFGLDKYAVFHAKTGKVEDPENGLPIMGETVSKTYGLRISTNNLVYSNSSVSQTQLLENEWKRRSFPELKKFVNLS